MRHGLESYIFDRLATVVDPSSCVSHKSLAKIVCIRAALAQGSPVRYADGASGRRI